MSDLAFTEEASASADGAPCPDRSVVERTAWRRAEIAPGVHVERALPLRKRRTIGAWCFLDLAGPFDPDLGIPLDVGPHPHMGLQTVTWLFDGQVEHRDSLGSAQTIRPGQLNLMTAGAGITHSEHSPLPGPGTGGTHLAQLWVALPDGIREGAPAFEHHADLPGTSAGGVEATVLLGEHDGEGSPASVHTAIVGLEVRLAPGAERSLPLDAAFEHGVVVVEGSVRMAGDAAAPGELIYLGRGRDSLPLAADSAARLLVLGGEPFGGDILMWWNFVARTRDEIDQARADWMGSMAGDPVAGSRFPQLPHDASAPIPAPPTPWTRGGSS